MRTIWLIVAFFILGFIGCTDSESEELIEGHWHASKIIERDGIKEHNLPNGIHLIFNYPKYSFKGKQDEVGNYYIKNEQLHLIPENLNTERDIKILKLNADSLTLELVDSMEIREVQFLRNTQ